MKELAFYRFLPLSHILSCVTYIVRLINHLPIIVKLSFKESFNISQMFSTEVWGAVHPLEKPGRLRLGGKTDGF
jgi:hypothetical protein